MFFCGFLLYDQRVACFLFDETKHQNPLDQTSNKTKNINETKQNRGRASQTETKKETIADRFVIEHFSSNSTSH